MKSGPKRLAEWLAWIRKIIYLTVFLFQASKFAVFAASVPAQGENESTDYCLGPKQESIKSINCIGNKSTQRAWLPLKDKD